MSYNNDIYHLSAELVGHEKCVRCICVIKDDRIVTGGLDNHIIVWKRTKKNIWEQQKLLRHHSKYVLTVECSNIPIGSGEDVLTFYSGGLDKVVYRVSTNGKIISKFQGHTSAVCSLLEISKFEILISGSWDGTARIWDLNSTNCRQILSGHAHAVSFEVTPFVKNENIYLISGSQNKTLFLWNIPTGNLVRSIYNSHDDIIRSISVSKTEFEDHKLIVATVSNDCKIKLWELYLKQSEESIILKKTIIHHNSFIFDVLFSKNHSKRLFTASDDCTVAVWELSKNFDLILKQSIPFSATVWSIKEIIFDDFLVTVSEDNICRIWTTKLEEAMPQELRTAQKEKILVDTKLSNSNKKNDSQENFNNFKEIPDITQMHFYKGKKNGTVKLFKNKDQIVAYEWNEDNWKLAGTVVQMNDKNRIRYIGDTHFPSGLYDYVFNIEFEGCSSKKLPYNIGDDLSILAQNFCEREGIDKNYCATICDYIRKSALEIADLNGTQSSSSFVDEFKPCLEYKLFKNVNIDGLISKIMKDSPKLINNVYENKIIDSNDDTYLFETELEHLNNLFNRIKNEISRNSISSIKTHIKSVEMDIIYRKMSTWLGVRDIALPVIDLWRILALHPQSSDIHKKSDQGWWLLASVLKLIDSIFLNVPNNSNPNDNQLCNMILLVCFRFFCNMFYNTTNREVMISRKNEILSVINMSICQITNENSNFSKKGNIDNILLSLLALILNYTIALNYKCCHSIDSRNLFLLLAAKLVPITCSNSFMKNSNELVYYQLLILSNNYYHFLKYGILSNIYIFEEKLLDDISDFISKNESNNNHVNSEKILSFIRATKSYFKSVF